MRKILLLFFIAINAKQMSAQDDKMQWFSDAKLGIFIHWGIYAVDGTDESWAFYNNKVTYSKYMSQLPRFSASRYRPEQWVDLIAASGARYAVLTAKHHDGVALWQTRQKPTGAEDALSIPSLSSAKRDVLSPFITALKNKGLKAGVYYSILDWSHPDYPGFRKDSTRYSIAQDSIRWSRFQEFNKAQLRELMDEQNPDLWWFDGGWEHSAKEWQAKEIRAMLLQKNANSIINERLTDHGDYSTPEQNFPISRPKQKNWELCMTTNDNWGFQHKDQNWKTPKEIITIFADVVANGGNLLLDIGPMEDGTIPPEQVNILKELGRWNKKHEEAIFNSVPGLSPGHFYGPSTLSKDSTALYLFLPGNATGAIEVKGIVNPVRKAEILGTSQICNFKVVGKISWSSKPGLLFIDVPDDRRYLDPMMTIIKLSFDKPLKFYEGEGGL
jgi:alpha-L-fucosidase